MHANRNTIERIRQLARASGVRPAELLKMAREAEQEFGLPGLEFLSAAGAAQLERDLRRAAADARWMARLDRQFTMARA